MSNDPHESASWYRNAYRDAQMRIGRDLRAYYELPRDVPNCMLALVAQLDKRQEQER
jgi:hypothetical protein